MFPKRSVLGVTAGNLIRLLLCNDAHQPLREKITINFLVVLGGFEFGLTDPQAHSRGKIWSTILIILFFNIGIQTRTYSGPIFGHKMRYVITLSTIILQFDYEFRLYDSKILTTIVMRKKFPSTTTRSISLEINVFFTNN